MGDTDAHLLSCAGKCGWGGGVKSDPPIPNSVVPKSGKLVHIPIVMDANDEDEPVMEDDPISSSEDDMTLAARFQARF